MSIVSLVTRSTHIIDFIKNGLQKGFDSSGGIIVEPKENGDGEWR